MQGEPLKAIPHSQNCSAYLLVVQRSILSTVDTLTWKHPTIHAPSTLPAYEIKFQVRLWTRDQERSYVQIQ